jgi:hypothetical protein
MTASVNLFFEGRSKSGSRSAVTDFGRGVFTTASDTLPKFAASRCELRPPLKGEVTSLASAGQRW